ncbi:MAG: phage protein GemA/Gp16 family protein, partial [Candidatus Methanospirareceae archaeon]
MSEGGKLNNFLTVSGEEGKVEGVEEVEEVVVDGEEELETIKEAQERIKRLGWTREEFRDWLERNFGERVMGKLSVADQKKVVEMLDDLIRRDEEKRERGKELRDFIAKVQECAKEVGMTKEELQSWLERNFGVKQLSYIKDEERGRVLEMLEEMGKDKSKERVCVECGKSISEKEYEYSMRDFERPVCYTCQQRLKIEGEKKEVRDLDWLWNLEPDVMMVFGPTGTLKTQLCRWIYEVAKEKGLRVKYVDTERNLTRKEIEEMGEDYEYIPTVEGILKFSENPPDVDIVIIDSVAFPVMTKFAKMNMRERGLALLNLIAISGNLKEANYRNNGRPVSILISQPQSELSGLEEEERR